VCSLDVGKEVGAVSAGLSSPRSVLDYLTL